MKFKKGDIIDVVGSDAFIDYYGKIEIIKIEKFEKACLYHSDFYDTWFDDDQFYTQCKESIKKVYIGRLLEDSCVGKSGKLVAFAEEFINLKHTRRL